MTRHTLPPLPDPCTIEQRSALGCQGAVDEMTLAAADMRRVGRDDVAAELEIAAARAYRALSGVLDPSGAVHEWRERETAIVPRKESA